MATLNQIHLPDALLAAITRRAEEGGVTIEEQLVRELTHAQETVSVNEQALLNEIRADRKTMAAEGTHLTDELLREARNWGRK